MPAARNWRARSVARGTGWTARRRGTRHPRRPPDPPDDRLHVDDGVGLVAGLDDDLDVVTELAVRHVFRERVEARERVRRNRRPPPLDDVTVVVVVRGLIRMILNLRFAIALTRPPRSLRQRHDASGRRGSSESRPAKTSTKWSSCVRPSGGVSASSDVVEGGRVGLHALLDREIAPHHARPSGRDCG